MSEGLYRGFSPEQLRARAEEIARDGYASPEDEEIVALVQDYLRLITLADGRCRCVGDAGGVWAVEDASGL